MKRYLLLLILCISFCVTLTAQDQIQVKSSIPDSLQQAINNAAKSNNPDLLYNIGVDFYTLGEVGYANLYFLKALRLNSAHKQARANLDTSIRLGSDSALYPQHAFLGRVLLQLIANLSVNRLAVLSLVFLLLSSLALAWLLFYDPAKERALPILTLSLLLLLCLGFFLSLGIKSYAQRHDNRAVVISSVSAVYPQTGTTPIMEVHKGLIVKTLNKKGEWWLVRLPNGQVGKLKASDCRSVY